MASRCATGEGSVPPAVEILGEGATGWLKLCAFALGMAAAKRNAVVSVGAWFTAVLCRISCGGGGDAI